MEMNLKVALSLILLLLLSANAEDAIPMFTILGANEVTKIDQKDPWLPSLKLRESLKKRCEECMRGNSVRGNSNCSFDGTCLLRLGRVGFRPGSGESSSSPGLSSTL